MELTGAQILVQSLMAQGVDTVFGYPGGAVLNIYDALWEARGRLRHVLTCHEQGAAHAADGYARATGRPGVVVATSGPGASNLVTGLAAAYHDSVPLVAITGNVSRDLIGRDAFQELDIIDVTNPIVKHNYFVRRVEDIPALVRQAFEIATSGRQGPVLIDIPKDLTAQTAPYLPQPAYVPRPCPRPETARLEAAARMVADSRRPLIYFGGGVAFSGAGQALTAFAEKLEAPLCASMMGLGAVPTDHPHYLGLVGMHGTVASNWAVAQCDLLIAVGARFSDRVTGNRFGFAPSAQVLHLDIDPAEMSKNIAAHLPLVGDCGQALAALAALVPRRTGSPWLQAVAAHKAATAPPPPVLRGDGPINPRAMVHALARAVGDDAIIVTDVGQHQMVTAQHYPFTAPRTFLSSCGLGAMGYGLGAANGAAVGCPGRRVALVTGDGSFHMNLPELAVSVTEGLDITVVVMNNGVLGMVHQWQRLFYGGRYACTEVTRATDFAALARAFGARGYRAETPDALADALAAAVSRPGPAVVDCVVPREACVFPIIPPGGGVEDTITQADLIHLDK